MIIYDYIYIYTYMIIYDYIYMVYINGNILDNPL